MLVSVPHPDFRSPWLIFVISCLIYISYAQAQISSESRIKKLAVALSSAKTEQERQRLLATEKDLVSAELWKALADQGAGENLHGNYQQALTVYAIAKSIAEQIKDNAGIAASQRGMGIAQYRLGDYSLAMEYFQRSLELTEGLNDKAGTAESLNQIGYVHYLQGEPGEAMKSYKQSLTFYEALNHQSGMAQALDNMGVVHRSQGDYGQAMEYFRKSLAMRQASGDQMGIATTLNNIGIIYANEGNYNSALEYYRKSLKLKEGLGDKTGIAATLNNIGIVCYWQGDYALSLQYHRRSLTIREAIGDKTGIASSLNQIGYVYALQGDFDIALQYLHQSLNLRKILKNKAGIAQVMLDIGSIHTSEANYVDAMEYYRKSLKLKDELGDKMGIAMVLNAMAFVYESQRKYDLALENYQKSLQLHEILNNKAYIANGLSNIAENHYWKKNYTLALEFADRSRVLSKQISNPTSLLKAAYIVGLVYSALHQPDRARQAFEESISTIESLRSHITGGEREQRNFLAEMTEPYYSMVEFLLAQNNSSEALSYAERAKGRVLLDILQSGKIDITKAMTHDEREQEQKLNQELVWLNSQIFSGNANSHPDIARMATLNSDLQKARLKFEDFRTQLYARHPELRIHRGETRNLTEEDIHELLIDSSTALLEYALTDEKVFLFVATRNQEPDSKAIDLRAYVLNVNRKNLTAQIEHFRQQLASRDMSFQEHAGKLYDLLLKPAHNQLRKKTSLVIVPDGALWDLPFQALLVSPDRYLIEQSAISYAPSLTVLREMVKFRKSDDRRPPAASLLAFGNPNLGKETIQQVRLAYRNEKLQPLPGAETEVKSLGKLYGSKESKIYVGAEAREDRFKSDAGNYNILHLATHGILNDASPMYSELVLAQGSGGQMEDGLLEAREIMDLDLHADLVVLSACETARGRITSGEGMIGLTWALFVAGSPAAVVSQWKVESTSTSELMLEFHRKLQSGNANSLKHISKARALQQAAIKLLRTAAYRHPFYWAPFIIVGNAS